MNKDKEHQKEDLSPEERRKKMQSNPHGSHKEKAAENRGKSDEEGFMQGLRSKEPPKEEEPEANERRRPMDTTGGLRQAQAKDKNEGQGRPQK